MPTGIEGPEPPDVAEIIRSCRFGPCGPFTAAVRACEHVPVAARHPDILVVYRLHLQKRHVDAVSHVRVRSGPSSRIAAAGRGLEYDPLPAVIAAPLVPDNPAIVGISEPDYAVYSSRKCFKV